MLNSKRKLAVFLIGWDVLVILTTFMGFMINGWKKDDPIVIASVSIMAVVMMTLTVIILKGVKFNKH